MLNAVTMVRRRNPFKNTSEGFDGYLKSPPLDRVLGRLKTCQVSGK
jgi:hypothetical protein